MLFKRFSFTFLIFSLGAFLTLQACAALLLNGSSMVVNGYDGKRGCTQEVIQEALLAIKQNNGGTLKLKRGGVYRIHPITEHIFVLPSNIIIEGNGATFIIDDNINTNTFSWDALFFSEGGNNVIIKDLTIDANGKNNSIKQKSVPDGATRHNGLYSALYTDNITIKNCTIKDVKGYGAIYLGYCNNVVIEACSFYDIGVEHSNQYIGDASAIMGVGNNWKIHDNLFENSYLSNCGTALDLACANSIIESNIVKSFWAGANLANNGLSESHNVLLRNNEFINNSTAIYLWSSTNPYKGSCYDNVIVNNKIEWITGRGWRVRGIDMGYFVYGDVYNISIERNSFTAINDDNVKDSYEIAVRIGPTEKTYSGTNNVGGIVRDVTLRKNIFSDCSGPAIQIERISRNILILDNVVDDVSWGDVPYATKSAIVLGGYTNEVGPDGITIEKNKINKEHKSHPNPVYIGAEPKRQKSLRIIQGK